MRFGITGASGRIGKLLISKGCIPLECDITDSVQVERAITQTKPDVVAHLASLSNVDYCELPENKEEVIKANLRGTANVLEYCSNGSIPMVFLSTDHIFDGKHGPYFENEKVKSPLNFYGLSKLTAEALVSTDTNSKIVRCSYMFDEQRILSAWQERFFGFPTFIKRSFISTYQFAELFWKYLNIFDAMPKVLHLSGSDTVSWFEFMLGVADAYKTDRSMVGMRNSEPPDIGLAPRPHKAGLKTNLAKKLGFPQFNFQTGLKDIRERRILKELGY